MLTVNGMTKGLTLLNMFACGAYANVVFPLCRRYSSVNPVAVYYHIVSDRPVLHIQNLYTFRSLNQFTKDMEVLLRYYRPLSLQDLLEGLAGRQAIPRDSFFLSFDDGLRECREIIAPVLAKKGIPATFFLCSAFVDNKELAYDFKKSLLVERLKHCSRVKLLSRPLAKILGIGAQDETNIMAAVLEVNYPRRHVLDQLATLLECDFSEYLLNERPYLNSTQVRELLGMGHAIGGHSIDHPRYADLDLVEQIRQTRKCMNFVKQNFSLEYGAFAFPSSDVNVPAQFFSTMRASGDVDVFFGNHGWLSDCVLRNVQRSSMEKTMMPAEVILGRSYARRIYRWGMGKLKIQRN
jgi:peptidoglycan/xylan/chitin deacetylase (PgdA/CDA1 family)